MTALPERQVLVEMVTQAQRTGARLALPAMRAGVSVRTYERWVADGELGIDGRLPAERPEPAHKLNGGSASA